MNDAAFAKEMERPYWLNLHGHMGRFHLSDSLDDWHELTVEQAQAAFNAIASINHEIVE